MIKCGFAVFSLIQTCLYLTGVFLLAFGPLPTHGRPVTSTSDSDYMDTEPFFESHRNPSTSVTFSGPSEPQKNSPSFPDPSDSRMIVRVIVTSSSSSSSSDSDENSDISTFHDFSFPIFSTSTSAPTSTKATTTTMRTPSNSGNLELEKDLSQPRKPVEDIFSVFYRAFSQNSPVNVMSDSSDNVERFQLFYPPTPRQSKLHSSPDQKVQDEMVDLNSQLSQENKSDKDKSQSKSIIDELSSTNTKTKVVAFSHSSSISSSSSSTRGFSRQPEPRSQNRQIVSTSTSSSISSSFSHNSHVVKNVNNNVKAMNMMRNHHKGEPRTSTTGSVPQSIRSFRRRPRPRQRPVHVAISSSESSDSNAESGRKVANNWDHKNDNNEERPRGGGDRPIIASSNMREEEPKASPLVQQLSTTTQTPISSPQSSPTSRSTFWQQPEKVWAQPEEVWSLPEKVWGQPERVWGQPEKAWGQPEQNWGMQYQPRNSRSSTTAATSTTTTRKPRYNKHYTNPMYSKTLQVSQDDEDYQRDSASDPETEVNIKDTKSSPGSEGTFVILGDDETEQDSIDGEFDRHLGIPMPSPSPKSHFNFNSNPNFNFSFHNNPTFKNINFSNVSSQSQFKSNFSNASSNEDSSDSLVQNSGNSNTSKKGKKFGYVLEGSNVRRYRVEERTPDGFIVGEYGVLNNQNAFLRGVRYTADGTINPRLIHEALMKFLSLR